ncbi:hypothetical protein WR25_09066 [Diploscapter pachys]|uniref:7TM GPCR serpentine receptor class x (Srx) domain-containing protein n=1 Tax=Diploscapter pachys TaxID=2018661 RepID=A0A2A2JMZ2_9BILA|nr:hypothetical protein WR25_09066 [Diploscapter pachys]
MDQDNDTYSYLYGSKESEDFLCATLLLILSTNIDLRYGVIAFIISSFIDITTLVQLRMANTKLTHIRISSRRSESDAVKIQKREVAFFLQSFANTLMFCGMLVCFHIISYWPFVVSSRFASFLSTTYIWGFSHTVSGLTLVIFNKEIRRRLLHPSDFLRTDTLSTKFNTPMQPSVITVSAFQTNGPRYNNSFGKKVFTHQTM